MLKRQFEVHPIANVFPMMAEEDYARLRDDIRDNGQHESIVFWKELLIDGRNRLRACEEIGIEPETCELPEEEDPVAYVLSANLHRRQLHPSQRAMIAAKMATLAKHKKKTDGSNDLSQDDVALLLSVSTPQVKRAKHVLEHGSQPLIDAVEQRQVTVSMAEKLCKACPDKREQNKLLKDGKQAIKEFLNPTPNDSGPPMDDHDAEFGDQYEYNIVKLFDHADYRLNTLKMLVKRLDDTELVVLKDWLGDASRDS